MIEVFDEKDVEECLAEVADSDIKTYAFWLLDWAVQKRKIQAISLDKIKKDLEQTYEIRKEVLHSNKTYEPNDVLEIIDEITAYFEKYIEE